MLLNHYDADPAVPAGAKLATARLRYLRETGRRATHCWTSPQDAKALAQSRFLPLVVRARSWIAFGQFYVGREDAA